MSMKILKQVASLIGVTREEAEECIIGEQRIELEDQAKMIYLQKQAIRSLKK